MVERRVTLPKRHGVAKAVPNRQQFAEPPHAGLVDGLAGHPPLAPQPLERAGIGTVGTAALDPAGVLHFKKVSTIGAAEVGLRVSASNPSPASETAQLMQIVVHTLVLAYQCTASFAVDARLLKAHAEEISIRAARTAADCACRRPNAAARGRRRRPGAGSAAGSCPIRNEYRHSCRGNVPGLCRAHHADSQ